MKNKKIKQTRPKDPNQAVPPRHMWSKTQRHVNDPRSLCAQNRGAVPEAGFPKEIAAIGDSYLNADVEGADLYWSGSVNKRVGSPADVPRDCVTVF